MTRLPSVLILILCSLNVFAQKKFESDHENFFRVGLKAGVNLNKTNGESFNKSYSFNYLAGGFVQLNFSKRFGLQPEINFVQARAEFSTHSSDVYDDLFRDGTQKRVKFSQLEIPLLLNVNLGESNRVKLQAGPMFGKTVSESADSLAISKNIYRQDEWSVLGGLWFQLPLVNLGARYKAGLTNMNNIDARENWKNQAIQLFIGLTF